MPAVVFRVRVACVLCDPGVYDLPTTTLVEFSLIQLTFWLGKWHEVAEIDSCHDVDAHLHQNARSTGERVGEPVLITAIHTLDGVQHAYNAALDHIESQWSTLKKRWHYG